MRLTFFRSIIPYHDTAINQINHWRKVNTMKTLPDSILTKHQVKTFRKDFFDGEQPITLIIELRYDDKCSNGHNSFAITGELYEAYRQPGEKTVQHSSGKKLWLNSCGCLHDDIAKYFPEYSKYIKWHLCNSDGPLGYIENTLYLAGDRDCWGKIKGEVSAYDEKVFFGDFPISFKCPIKFIQWVKNQNPKKLSIVSIAHAKEPKTFSPNYTFAGYGKTWYDCPFRNDSEAKEFLAAYKRFPLRIEQVPAGYSEGKEREFDAARHSAVWPEATEETLSLPKEQLKAILIERQDGLVMEFKKAMEEIGFIY